MMITLPEVTSAVYGVARLMRLDKSGYSFLDNSRRGFFMSFWSAVFILPGIFVLGRFTPSADQIGVDPFRFLSVSAISYVIGWIAFPMVIWHVAEKIDRLHRYILYIVAYNWASILQVAILVAIEMSGQIGLLPMGLVNFISFIVIIAILAWSGYIAKTALDVTIPVACAIVGFDLLLAISLEQIKALMIY